MELGLAKLTLAQPISEPSDKPKDTITRQSPAAGERVAQGTTVTVWVSAGPAGGKVEVPNLVGGTQDEALAQLEQLKLLGLSTPVDSDKPAGQVVSQSPKPGQLVVEGSTVTFQVSNGPNPTVSVPAVIGLTQGQANAKLVLAGLKGHSTADPRRCACRHGDGSDSGRGDDRQQGFHRRDRGLNRSAAHDDHHRAASDHHHDLRRGLSREPRRDPHDVVVARRRRWMP